MCAVCGSFGAVLEILVITYYTGSVFCKFGEIGGGRGGGGTREEAPGQTRISARMLMKEKHEIEYSVGRDQAEFPGDASYSVPDSWEVYCWEDHGQVIPKQASQTLLDGPPFPAVLGHPVLWGVTT